jgi:hypothetical protein
MEVECRMAVEWWSNAERWSNNDSAQLPFIVALSYYASVAHRHGGSKSFASCSAVSKRKKKKGQH